MTIDGPISGRNIGLSNSAIQADRSTTPLRFRIGRLEILGKGFHSFAKQDFAAIIFTWADDTQ
jgi:hypothetical protein